MKNYKRRFDDLKILKRELDEKCVANDDGGRENRGIRTKHALENGLDELEDAGRTLNETTALTDEIRGELLGSKHIILRAKKLTDETENDLNKSEAIINLLRHKEMMKRLILFIIAIVLFSLNVVVLWYKLKRII